VRVLLVEDDEMIGVSLKTGLRQDGLAVDWVRDADAADSAMVLAPYDMLLLDLGLPGRSGLELLRGMRRRHVDLPVLIITARDAIADRVAGLDATTTSSSRLT